MSKELQQYEDKYLPDTKRLMRNDVLPFVYVPVRSYLGIDMDGVITIPIEELIIKGALDEHSNTQS
jgi:hypothetical protein